MHRLKENAIVPKYDMKTLKLYIGFVRKIKPQLTEESAKLLRTFYIEIRGKDKNNSNSYRVTVRQLESMIRLSEAYARLEVCFKIEPRHVREAYRLLSCSILKLEKPNIDLNE
jgi:DNA replication licensing factor MCM6